MDILRDKVMGQWMDGGLRKPIQLVAGMSPNLVFRADEASVTSNGSRGIRVQCLFNSYRGTPFAWCSGQTGQLETESAQGASQVERH
jgi:hypothetical protein